MEVHTGEVHIEFITLRMLLHSKLVYKNVHRGKEKSEMRIGESHYLDQVTTNDFTN